MNKSWEIPQELRSGPPRVVRRRGGLGPVILASLFVLPFIVGAIVMTLISVGEPLIMALTPALSGQANSIYTTHSSKGGTTWNLKYVYWPNPLNRKEQQFGDCQLTYSEGLAMREGQKISVHEATFGSFHYSFIDRPVGDFVSYRWIFWIFTAVWDGMLVFLLRSSARQQNRLKKFVREGQAARGVITGKVVKSGSRSTSYRVKYRYTTLPPDSSQRDGDMLVDRTKYNSVTDGDAVTILYTSDPADRSIIYEFSDFIAERF